MSPPAPLVVPRHIGEALNQSGTNGNRGNATLFLAHLENIVDVTGRRPVPNPIAESLEATTIDNIDLLRSVHAVTEKLGWVRKTKAPKGATFPSARYVTLSDAYWEAVAVHAEDYNPRAWALHRQRGFNGNNLQFAEGLLEGDDADDQLSLLDHTDTIPVGV